MALISKNKVIDILFTDEARILLSGVSDVGEVEGWDGFVGFWRNSEEIPFRIIKKDTILSVSIETEIDRSRKGDKSDNG